MNPMAIFGALSLVASAYMILCVLRVALTWFGPRAGENPALRPLVAVVDPYLGFFRRFRGLVRGGMDFSPVVAITLLWFVSTVLQSVAVTGVLSLGNVLGIALAGLWSIATLPLDLFAVLVLVRLVAFYARWNSLHPGWRMVDGLIDPLVFRVKRFFYRDRIVKYPAGLLTTLAVLVAFRIIGTVIVRTLSELVARIPV